MSNHRNLLIHTDSFTSNPSCIFWMTCDTKYIQTSNLKLSFKNWETLLKFLIWINPYQSIRYRTYYGKWKANTYLFRIKKGVFCNEKVPLEIEWIVSCKKDQICCFSNSPVVWCVFYRHCPRKLLKDFGDCRSGANRSTGFSG